MRTSVPRATNSSRISAARCRLSPLRGALRLGRLQRALAKGLLDAVGEPRAGLVQHDLVAGQRDTLPVEPYRSFGFEPVEQDPPALLAHLRRDPGSKRLA